MLEDIKRASKLLSLSDPMLLKPGNSVVNYENIVIAKFPTPNVEQELGIWSMGQLNKLIKLIGEPTIKIENNMMVLEGNGIIQKFELVSNLLDSFTADEAIFNKVENAEEVGKLSITTDVLKYIKQVASIMGHQQIVFGPNELIITTLQGNDFQNPNVKSIDTDNLKDKFVIDYNLLTKLPEGDYSVEFHRNDKGVVVSLWKAMDDDLDIILAINKQI